LNGKNKTAANDQVDGKNMSTLTPAQPDSLVLSG
jgi:hypothetical protein